MGDNSQFEAVIFDSDGVLVDSEALGVVIERESLAELGLHYDPQDYVQRFLGQTDADYLAALDEDAKAVLGHPLPGDFCEILVARRDEVYRRELQPLAGNADLVRALPHPKAVASSATVYELDRTFT